MRDDSLGSFRQLSMAIKDSGQTRTRVVESPLLSRIERKYRLILISTSCLTGLFDISILLRI